MPKVQKRRGRTTKASPFEAMAVDEVVPAEEIVEEEVVDTGVESNHAVHKRQAGEWKRMKAQVSQLKTQRKSLTKKQREKKKQISQQIKMLISSLSDKHEAELRSLGIVPPKRADMMLDEDLNDE